MPGTLEAFTQGADTVAVSASTTSASQSFTAGLSHLLVTNASTQLAFFTTGIGSATASATKTPIVPGAQAVVSIPTDHNTVAAVLAASTGTIYFTPGYGT
jgi:hypothetical protein